MHKKILLVGVLIPLLSACSGEPSEEALKQAYQHSLDQTNQVADRTGLKNMHIELAEFKKVSCAKQQDGYQCQIDVALNMPMMGNQQQQGTVFAVKKNGDWVITPDQ